jgi:hypothetical protein
LVVPIVSVVVVKFVTVAEAEVKTVMFPETLEMVPEKPLSEITGPENWVLAIIELLLDVRT